MQDLLDNFLSFAKVRKLNQQPTNLNDQVKQVFDFFRPKATEAGIEIVDYLAADLPTVLLDREAFHGALLNLVLNAEQAMPKGGQLVVRTSTVGDGVALDLIDTGCGMDDETQAQIFDAFFSTKAAAPVWVCPPRERSSRPTAARSRCKAKPGRGTQFTIKLPLPPRLADQSIRAE